MARFATALESNPAPRALGDIALRYEPSMLIGETEKGRASSQSSAAWLVGFSLLLCALGALILQGDTTVIAALVGAGAAAMGFAVWLARVEKRQRRFVANFGTVSLRLDFSSPIAGQPRTLVVPFDSVRAVGLERQADGASCLCVDFVLGRGLMREVLAAYIPEAQLPDAERLERVLRGAFGLGAPPGQGEPTLDGDTSSFE